MFVFPTKPKKLFVVVTSLVVVSTLKSAKSTLKTTSPGARLPPVYKLKKSPPKAVVLRLKLVKKRSKPSESRVKQLPKE